MSALPKNAPASQLKPSEIGPVVEEELRKIRIIDVHTHLFMPALGKLGLWGIDELLTYHYLEAELFRSSPIQPSAYWNLSKREQADVIWRTLFVENPPISEATRGVISVLHAFGLGTRSADLREAREFFAASATRATYSEGFRVSRNQLRRHDERSPGSG